MNWWAGGIATSACLCACLRAFGGEELLQNGGFESPPVTGETSAMNPQDWTLFSSVPAGQKIALSSKISHNGKQCAQLAAQGRADAYQGMFQSTPVSLGTSCRFTAYLRNDKDHPLRGSMRGQISIEWKNSEGNEIERVWGPDWGASLSSLEWTKVEMLARPPANASRAHFVITQFDGKEADSSGAFLVDEVSVTAQ
jgi:hypothetical protein